MIIGLATKNEALVHRVELVVHRRAQLDVASDGEAATRLLSNDECDVRVLDLSSADILPDGMATCPIFGPASRSPIVMIRTNDRTAPLANATVQTYSHSEVPRFLDELSRMLPRQGSIDAAHTILGETAAIRLVRDQVRSVSRYAGVPVLILGETGTGKELVAEAIHRLSAGASPFVAINCAAIPETLFESELFGHEAGAYTGARGARVGLFETAGEGTVFLDEVGELPSALQPKLLRVLESRTFRRVGGARDIVLGARVVSATNRGLNHEEDGLRSDLRYRLAGFTITLPSLRERKHDIAEIADMFLQAFAKRHAIDGIAFTPDALDVLRGHDWPGNVRELRTVVEHAAIVRSTGAIAGHELRAIIERVARTPANVVQLVPTQTSVRLRDLERATIERAFVDSGRNVSRAARQLGIPRTTLNDKLRRYSVAR